MPECADTRLRFALIDDGFGYYFNIYLKLESWSVSCMDSFLSANGMVDTFQATQVGGVEAERPLSQHRLWTDSQPVREMSWQLGPDQRFQQFAVTTEKMYSVTTLVQHLPGTANVQAFVYAFRGG
jgi:hypothetical protein